MCAACGVPTHVAVLDSADPARPEAGQPAKFAALRNPECRRYLVGGGLSMMGDNIEHVVTYWVVWQRFHSPALTGFEVISHWLPFLLLSPYFGALADHYDCRKLIQASQGLFMLVSLAWGVLFATGTLTVWNACVLLILHGMAGALWAPPEQLLLEDFVGPADLPSAIRLNSTARSLGILCGPVVGSALLLGLGPTRGIWVNIAFYLPLTVLVARTRFTGHTRSGITAKARVSLLSAVRVFRDVSRDRVLAAMIILAGLGAFFVGSAMQTSMPSIADTTTGLPGGTAYGVLLFANGLGGVLGGLLLEGTGWIRLSVRAALWSTAVYGITSVFFAVSHNYLIAAPLLVIGGVANLAALSITQTVAQLRAPDDKKGQVIGVYGVGANGMRIGSGLTVGLFGAAVGLRPALGWSSAALCACVGLLALYLAFAARRSPAPEGAGA
ncbi:MAG TPA: MFS transporter [Trebonia sp.]|jgi:MFS family permease|nr:MFS transporter [Trebonia sp.]